MKEKPNNAWPARPSWGFAAFYLILSCIGLVVVWFINYRQAFGG